MSAFQLSAAHIATMVDAAILHRMSSFYDHTERRTVRVSHETREELCVMLAHENMLSLQARYGDDSAVDRFPRHPSKALNLSPVALLKAVQCYEYQSCEHDAWRESGAFHFCQGLKATLVHALPGYDSADTWGIAP